MSGDLRDLADGCPEDVSCSSRAVKLLDDLAHTLQSLRSCLLMRDRAADDTATAEDTGQKSDTQCVMSEDERQMLEMQARQEQMDEECILAFQTQEQSAQNESDEDLDDEMMKCADHLEKENHKKSAAEDEDEDVEEDEEEVFDSDIPQAEQIKCLKMFFGHHNFKPVQWKVIRSVLEDRRDNLVVMATGYGKSLCFQFPPVYCQNISVVISPLIALMEDQVLHLQMSNIPACFLGSAQTRNLSEDVKRGQFRVVYMTPEFCSGNISLLVQLNRTIGLSLIAVDEAHCISQWGHDFRSAYRDLGKLKTNLPEVPILALTATASPSIRDDIVKSLHLVNPIMTCTSFDRPNLYLDVSRKSADVIRDLKQFLIKKKGGGLELEGSAIVYCPSKKEAERVTAALCKLDVSCGLYHAGLSIKQRTETHHQFMRDEIQCVVATVAFGMGINKSDIRKVIHYGAPKEMESYYQEIGRAGRDGLPSSCHVLWTSADMALNRFILNQSRSERFREYKISMMAKMEKYLNSTKCRRKLILSHFEDKRLRKVTSGILGSDQCCDNCRSGMEEGDADGLQQDFGLCSYQLMKAIKIMEERFGITAPILFLRGSNSQRVPERYRKHSHFGIGKDFSECWWKALGRELIAEQYLTEATGHNKFATLCKVTAKGRSWLNDAENETHRKLLLQPNRDLSVPRGSRTSHVAPEESYTSSKQSDFTQRSKVSSGVDSRHMMEKVGVSCRYDLQNPHIRTSSITTDDIIDLCSELYCKLVCERQKLASLKNIPPALLATNKILLDMAKLSSLKQLDGVSEAKASMLTPLIDIINTFCHTHTLQADVSSSSVADVQSESSRDCVCPSLPDSVSVTYRLFQTEHKTLRQVADVRSVPVAVVESHLLQAQKMNCPIHTQRAGLSPSIYNTITNIITSPPLSSDMSDFKAIRSRVSDDISNFLLRLALCKLQREGLASVRQEISWIEPLEKSSRAGDGVMQASDVMDQSEDELFTDLPMPQEDVDSASDGRLKSCDVSPHCSSMNLTSWNQDNLDQDTQDLFSDSPAESLTGFQHTGVPKTAKQTLKSVSHQSIGFTHTREEEEESVCASEVHGHKPEDQYESVLSPALTLMM
ncbi:Werner syndrome ATP-dependent helicase -like protein [Triplophysa tibetana]|uniref:DNA 3'-5' helicase n=1 Tax=Triplophysa tibetana TaxID=1572043 RepID=A0A5A9N3W2_9TELE|nr:Werner syndrome ATP-dependent helicase -like protein [Triplophysa tibetana]